MKKIVEYFFLCILVPIALNIIIYYGYTTQYTGNVFSESTFSSQYDHGVYKYRVLSKFMLLKTYKFLSKINVESEPKDFIKALDAKGTNNFYAAYFIFNTIFSIIFAMLVYYCFYYFKFLNFTNDFEKLMSFLNINLIMYISQYVIVPYDISGYVFLILSIILSIAYISQKKVVYLFFFCIVLVIATLNREMSFISFAFLATLMITEKGIKKNILKLLIPVLCFALTYIGLRIYFGIDNGFIEGIINNFAWNVITKNIIILIFSIGLSYLAFITTLNKKNKSLMFTFLIFNSPYILSCLLGGRWFVLMVFIPLYF
jgi:hypothetical protein